jgi:MATE family, multidrug efflux pump
VVAAELGWMAMGLVDTLMVSPLGPEAIGAVGIGNNVFLAVAIFGMGLLLGLDTLVSQAFGARRLDECHRWLWHGLVLAVGLSAPLATLVWFTPVLLVRLGVHSAVLPLATGYVRALAWSLLPLLLYAACRRYLQGRSIVRPVGFALVTANVVNAVTNWVLIYGKFGLPALGVEGAAWATTSARVYMFVVLAAAIVLAERGSASGLWQTPRAIERARLRRLTSIGLPAAGQLVLEIGVFATATTLAGRLVPAALAAHHVALNLAALAFMVPLGMASAGAVRVGQYVGRADAQGAKRAGWAVLALAVLVMTASAAVFATMPALLVRLFTPDVVVVATGVVLLRIAAVFQVFDGLQVAATGILRGLGETRAPLLANFVGHWMIGLPVGYYLCFGAEYGVSGLWIGLTLGLIIVAVTLVAVWRVRVRALTRRLAQEDRW